MKPDPVRFSTDPISELESFLEKEKVSAIAILVDENTEKYCLPHLTGSLKSKYYLIRINSGENFKNLQTCEYIWKELTRHQLDRKALMINLGGGVIGDMGGFCASTYKRGISFINIPTTLLAQVDASIGGKLGVDLNGYKNQVGMFRDPELVIIDPVFLETLPERELRSGFAEVIKHALIADDLHWKKIKSLPLHQMPWNEIIPHSVRIKAEVVKKDPWETGLRKILNFGHTIGHAIETHFLINTSDKLLHGEAIAAGMICEARLSQDLCGLPKQDFEEIKNYLLSVYGKVPINEKDVRAITELLIQDKKNESGKFLFSLLKRTGNCQFNMMVDFSQAENIISWYITL